MDKRKITSDWFASLRDQLCIAFELIETDYAVRKGLQSGKFIRKTWNRDDGGGGGGVMSVMKGNVFEKVGVNISKVFGTFSTEFSKQIPGAENDPRFFATGVSLVAHMRSPLIPAAHFNTRYIETTKGWFGGGSDLTPMYIDDSETELFHQFLKQACDQHDLTYYPKFKQNCNEYFFLKHRNEVRGIGGIFYDYMDNNFDNDFLFTKDVGKTFLDIYPRLIRNKIDKEWTAEQREFQLFKRGRYVEFNLLYDRGTKFGLATGGNTEAILMSMPPEVKWR